MAHAAILNWLMGWSNPKCKQAWPSSSRKVYMGYCQYTWSHVHQNTWNFTLYPHSWAGMRAPKASSIHFATEKPRQTHWHEGTEANSSHCRHLRYFISIEQGTRPTANASPLWSVTRCAFMMMRPAHTSQKVHRKGRMSCRIIKQEFKRVEPGMNTLRLGKHWCASLMCKLMNALQAKPVLLKANSIFVAELKPKP